jgi:hypothetical protein
VSEHFSDVLLPPVSGDDNGSTLDFVICVKNKEIDAFK